MKTSRICLTIMAACMAHSAKAELPQVLIVPPTFTPANAERGRQYTSLTEEALKSKATTKVHAAATGTCVDTACLKKAAQSSGYKWVITSQISESSNDELGTTDYQIETITYNDTTGDLTKDSTECLLCGDAELATSYKRQVEYSAKHFRVNNASTPNKPAQSTAKAASTTPLRITSNPAGAKVYLDGELIGTTPYEGQAVQGKHTIELRLKGYADESRSISVDNLSIDMPFQLKTVQGTRSTHDTASATPESPSNNPVQIITAEDTSVILNHDVLVDVGVGLTVGGVVLTGIGAYLLIIDGDTSCSSGKIYECPHIYDTKVGGLLTFGIGAALIGSGVTTLILDYVGRDHGNISTAVAPTNGGALVQFGGSF